MKNNSYNNDLSRNSANAGKFSEDFQIWKSGYSLPPRDTPLPFSFPPRHVILVILDCCYQLFKSCLSLCRFWRKHSSLHKYCNGCIQ